MKNNEEITTELLNKINACELVSYLAAGMIYLLDNPLLQKPLQPEHIKNRLLGQCPLCIGIYTSF